MATRGQVRREQTQGELDSREPPFESIVPQQIDNNTEGTSNKKTRGITKGMSVQKKMDKAEKLEITIHPQRRRIVGNNSKEFKTEACVILKQHAPLQYARWKDIPEDNKKKMWLAVKQKFNLKENYKVKEIVFEQLNRQYRSRRHKLHAYYLRNKDDEDILHKPPSELPKKVWEHLINHFVSDEFKKVSERNKENRKKLEITHACGTKSIAQYCYDERDPETEQEPTRTVAWLITHQSKKKNGWVDQASEEAYENLTRLQREPIEEGQDPMNEDEAFIRLFGEEKSSRLRGCGDSLKPPSKRLRISVELEKENEELKKKTEEYKESVESLEEKNKEMALRLESLESQVNNQATQMEDFLRSQLPAIIQNLGKSGHPPTND